jgi:hypothetical protein
MASLSQHLRPLRRRLAFLRTRIAEREAAGVKLEKGDFDKQEAWGLAWALEELTPRNPREELDEVGPGAGREGER